MMHRRQRSAAKTVARPKDVKRASRDGSWRGRAIRSGDVDRDRAEGAGGALIDACEEVDVGRPQAREDLVQRAHAQVALAALDVR